MLGLARTVCLRYDHADLEFENERTEVLKQQVVVAQIQVVVLCPGPGGSNVHHFVLS